MATARYGCVCGKVVSTTLHPGPVNRPLTPDERLAIATDLRETYKWIPGRLRPYVCSQTCYDAFDPDSEIDSRRPIQGNPALPMTIAPGAGSLTLTRAPSRLDLLIASLLHPLGPLCGLCGKKSELASQETVSAVIERAIEILHEIDERACNPNSLALTIENLVVENLAGRVLQLEKEIASLREETRWPSSAKRPGLTLFEDETRSKP